MYLRVDYDEDLARVRQDRFRPMLQRADLDQVYAARLAAYGEVAAVEVDTNGRRPDAVALDVLRELTRLPATPAGTSNILVTPVGGTYYAHVGRQLLDLVGALLPDATDIEQYRALGKESSRYDIGIRRGPDLLITPLLILGRFLQRFTFEPTADGLSFTETQSPSIQVTESPAR